MTLEETVKLALEATVAECRLCFDQPQREYARYEKLRIAVYRQFLEQCEDAEFAEFLQRTHPVFGNAGHEAREAKRVAKMMSSPDMIEASKQAHERLDDSHPA